MPSTLSLDKCLKPTPGELMKLQCRVNQFLQPVQREAHSALGQGDQGSQIEHHLKWDEGRLRQVDNKPENEVTMEADLTCPTHLVLRCLSKEDFIYARVHESCYRSLVKTLAMVA